MFKDILLDLMTEKGIETKRELSKLTGIPPTTISGWFNAGRLPDYSAIKKLSKFFNISADELLYLNNNFGTRTVAPMGAPALPSDEQILLNVYRNLSPDMRDTLWSLLSTWSPAANKFPTKPNKK